MDGGEQLIADLNALVQAGLIEERQSISATRFAARGDVGQDPEDAQCG